MNEHDLEMYRQFIKERDSEIKRLKAVLSDIAHRSFAPDDLAWCRRKAREALGE